MGKGYVTKLTKRQSAIYGLASLPRYNQYCRPAGVVADGYCMDIEKMHIFAGATVPYRIKREPGESPGQFPLL